MSTTTDRHTCPAQRQIDTLLDRINELTEERDAALKTVVVLRREGRRSIAKQITELVSIAKEDPEAAHGSLDDLILTILAPDERQAVEAVVDAAPGWWCA